MHMQRPTIPAGTLEGGGEASPEAAPPFPEDSPVVDPTAFQAAFLGSLAESPEVVVAAACRQHAPRSVVREFRLRVLGLGLPAKTVLFILAGGRRTGGVRQQNGSGEKG